MATPHTPRGRVSRWTRRGAATLIAVTAALTASPNPTVLAQPQSPATPAAADPGTSLKKLQKRANALEKEYRGDLETLGEAERAAERATRQADQAGRELEQAQTQVRGLAAASYMSGGFGSAPVLLNSIRPDGSITGASEVEYLARDNARRVEALATLAADAAQARGAAQTKIGKARKEVDDLEKQRTRVRKLLAKFTPETPVRQPAAPGRPDGATGTKSSIIGNTMTARMRTVLLEIDRKFGPFPAIGCYRAGDPQDHGSGRACDFMESTGGALPSAGATAHGTSVAQYAISNASRLGIKYIIWRQRIYDLRNPGWRAMEDRGGITANHFDHVHISVF